MAEYYTRIVSEIRDFLRLESSAGLLLLAAALLALVASNTPLESLYGAFLGIPVEIRVGALHLDKPLLLWINDGLMAVFFLLVGLEIKRELVEGELSTPAQAALPVAAALGGMAVPAAIYLAMNWADPVARAGWAIPSATDIAFAIGVLTLLGPRIPQSLKVFLLALAIIDDLGAIVIIALFYSGDLALSSLLFGSVAFAGLLLLNLMGVRRIAPYALLGIVLWVCVLKSGVHATLAGVVTAFCIPLREEPAYGPSPLKRLEHALHPWVAFLVMPLFGFANAGVSLTGDGGAALAGGVASGIALGLFLGKQLGAFGVAALAIKSGLARLPEGASWLGLYGTCVLAGIGFTMSLFIGTLAWDDAAYAAPLRLGVLGGSLLSGLVGYLILKVGDPAAKA
ncbi:MAG: Na+/H+ antiporter NhaA [Pseudomonadota bacterium]